MGLKTTLENRIRLKYPGSRRRDAPIDYSDQNVKINRPLYINSSPVVDHIVEQGTKGIWTYRKWESGIAECWGNYVGTGINAVENNYSGYYYSKSIDIPLPNDFISVDDYQVNGGSSDRINFARTFGAYLNSGLVSFVICGHQPEATSVSVSVHLSVKGRWK